MLYYDTISFMFLEKGITMILIANSKMQDFIYLLILKLLNFITNNCFDPEFAN